MSNGMKQLVWIGLALLTLSACRPDKKAPVDERIGMPNPASHYCVDQGGSLEITRTPEGDVGYCTLPDGTRTEEWELYRATMKDAQ